MKKITFKTLKKLLENHPTKESLTPGYKSDIECYLELIDSWFKEFTEAFNKFEEQLKEKLHRLESLRAGSIYTEEQEQGMMIILKEILGENNSEVK